MSEGVLADCALPVLTVLAVQTACTACAQNKAGPAPGLARATSCAPKGGEIGPTALTLEGRGKAGAEATAPAFAVAVRGTSTTTGGT